MKSLLPPLILLAVAAILIWFFFPQAHPNGGIKLPLDAATIAEQASTILDSLRIDRREYYSNVELHENQSLTRQVRDQLGIRKGNPLLRDTVPGYYWNVRWSKDAPGSIKFSSRNESDSQQEAESIARRLKGDMVMKMNTRGGMINYEYTIADSIQLPSISQQEAFARAEAFVNRYTEYSTRANDTTHQDPRRLLYDDAKSIQQKHRTDYEFNWHTTAPVTGNRVSVKVRFAGDMVKEFDALQEVPKEFKDSTNRTLVGVIIVVLYMAMIVAMIVLSFKRIRAFELGWRVAFIVGVVAAIALGIQLYLSMPNNIGFELLLSLIIGPLFYGGSLVLVWSVAESVVREVWKEKIVTIDLLSKGYVFHSRVGMALVRGIGLGALALALWLVTIECTDFIRPVWIGSGDENAIQTFGTFSPAFYSIFHSMYAHLFSLSFFLMFLVSTLRKRVQSTWAMMLIGGATFGILGMVKIEPLGAGFLIDMVLGAFFIWTFYRYDILTTYLMMASMTTMIDMASLIVSSHPSYLSSALILMAFFAVLFVIGIITFMRKETEIDFDAIAPAFARHISERQRLQQELEIARTVQMSFLPKANPKMLTLDIASRCAPALEVGGDYYDFIELGEHRLGVAVGDVSGKGTQAAFFMTLTKGFLRALAKVSNSPSAILTQVNRLFYENVERGVFISMVYGIFDTQQHTLTIARAGHNPVIMRKTLPNQIQVVNPMGLALGLDEGEIFSKSIQEISISFQPGDLFVFYTDGFPEAMNKTMEEFGEERLCKTIERYAVGSAADVMEGIFTEMKQFTGKAKQHDDMTIVVVKVT
ncbi:MAG: SpoIIE family protein phosphatase [bacterium]